MPVTAEEKLAKRLPFDSPQQEAYLNLWRAYDCCKTLEDALFGRYDLTAQQYNALRLLQAAHPQKIPTLMLASQLITRAPDITRLLDKLDERKLVERERPAENRRVVSVGITASGLDLLAELAPQVRDCHWQQLGHLAPDELEHLTHLLHKVRASHE